MHKIEFRLVEIKVIGAKIKEYLLNRPRYTESIDEMFALILRIFVEHTNGFDVDLLISVVHGRSGSVVKLRKGY